MHPIYSEMITRNWEYHQNENPVIFDNELGSSNDNRRCIALVAGGEWEFTPEFVDVMNSLINVMHDSIVLPTFHHTFLTAQPMSRDDQYVDIEKLQNAICTHVKPYSVTFDKVCPVKTGVAFIGGDDVLDDVNIMRDMLRKEGVIVNERYNTDILHFTGLRWRDNISVEQQKQMLEILSNKNQVFARLKVTTIKIMKASWLLNPDECEVLDIIDLT